VNHHTSRHPRLVLRSAVQLRPQIVDLDHSYGHKRNGFDIDTGANRAGERSARAQAGETRTSGEEDGQAPGIVSCDSLATPNSARANGETLADSETCGPNRKVCSRVFALRSVPYVPLKSATAPRKG
jgi:hypothetical protein